MYIDDEIIPKFNDLSTSDKVAIQQIQEEVSSDDCQTFILILKYD